MPDNLDELIAMGSDMPSPLVARREGANECHVEYDAHDYFEDLAIAFSDDQHDAESKANFIVAACNAATEMARELKALREKMGRVREIVGPVLEHWPHTLTSEQANQVNEVLSDRGA